MSGTLQRMWAYPSETCLWEVSQNIRQTCSLCRDDFDHDHFAQQAKNLVEARAIEIPSVEGTWTWCIGSINLLSQYVHLEYVPIVALKSLHFPVAHHWEIRRKVFTASLTSTTPSIQRRFRRRRKRSGSVPSAAYTGFLFQRFSVLGPEPFQDLQKVKLIVEEAPVLEGSWNRHP